MAWINKVVTKVKDAFWRVFRCVVLPIVGWFVGLYRKWHPSEPQPDVTGDPIRHVFVLMLENHSFDQMLGCYGTETQKVDGVEPSNPRWNTDLQGNRYSQEGLFADSAPFDPKHEFEAVQEQLSDNGGGFVRNFQRNYDAATTDDLQAVMNYFPKGRLPALHALADEFAICDHWFSSVPGPTWANRLFALSGTSMGRVEMFPTNPGGLRGYDQKTLFDLLQDAHLSWRVYYHDMPESLLLSRLRRPQMVANYFQIDGDGGQDSFEQALKSERGSFPGFCFIEPQYFGSDQNDDHPTASIMAAQRLIARVYESIRAVDETWRSSLLIVVYDEHGGFFDHCPPPSAIPPVVPSDYSHGDRHSHCPFNLLGLRVPALLISPWVPAGVVREPLDHTSIIRYVCQKWGLPSLTARDENSKVFESAFLANPREVPFLRITFPAAAKAVREVALQARQEAESDHQRALRGLMDHLEQEHLDARGRAVRAALPKKPVGDAAEEMRERSMNVMRSMRTPES